MNPRKVQRGLLALVALLGCLGAPGAARAQSESEKRQQAKEHYEMANRFYDVGKYGDAINEYEQAYLLVEDPALLFNIGQAYRLWDHPEDAIRSYKNYLRRRPDASNRADVEKKIADLERTLDERRRASALQPQPPPPSGVSGIPATVPPPVGNPPVYSSPANPASSAGPTVGEPTAPEPVVVPAPVQPGIDVSASPPPRSEPSQPKKWIAYSLLGVGGAGIVTSILAAAVGASKAQKLKTASQNREPFDPAVEANGKTANAIAAVSGLIGIAAGGTGGYLLWRWRGTSSPSVSIAPVAAPTYAGASALLTF
jgi:tetratricopeptide (TPR) repeat protein